MVATVVEVVVEFVEEDDEEEEEEEEEDGLDVEGAADEVLVETWSRETWSGTAEGRMVLSGSADSLDRANRLSPRRPPTNAITITARAVKAIARSLNTDAR